MSTLNGDFPVELTLNDSAWREAWETLARLHWEQAGHSMQHLLELPQSRANTSVHQTRKDEV